MKGIKKTICFVLCIALIINMSMIVKTNADKGENEVKKVLFIGNSMTYYNNLWNVFQGLAKRNGHDVEVEAATNGGKTILYNATADNCVAAIQKGDYDVVVLQDMVGTFDAETLQKGADKIIPIIKKYSPSAWIVFYEPWPVKNALTNPGSYLPYFTHSYIATAQKTGGVVAPAGEAFYDLYVNYKKNYYCSDGKHPQPLATFLAASTVYFSIYPDDAFNEFKASEQAFLDKLINDNVEYTTEGQKSTYPLNDLNLIYSLAHKYTRAVNDAMPGGGGYLSIGYEQEDLDAPYVYKVKIKKIVKKKKSMKIYVVKNPQIRGYQVQVSKKKKFKKKNIIFKKIIKKKNAIKKGIISIKSKKFKAKKLFVRVREFVYKQGEPKYGKWSKVKRVKA